MHLNPVAQWDRGQAEHAGRLCFRVESNRAQDSNIPTKLHNRLQCIEGWSTGCLVMLPVVRFHQNSDKTFSASIARFTVQHHFDTQLAHAQKGCNHSHTPVDAITVKLVSKSNSNKYKSNTNCIEKLHGQVCK